MALTVEQMLNFFKVFPPNTKVEIEVLGHTREAMGVDYAWDGEHAFAIIHDFRETAA